MAGMRYKNKVGNESKVKRESQLMTCLSLVSWQPFVGIVTETILKFVCCFEFSPCTRKKMFEGNFEKEADWWAVKVGNIGIEYQCLAL